MAFPMRCSFRTHLFSRMQFPGFAPWAGMRCPVGANGTMAFPIPRPRSQSGHRVPSGWCAPVGPNGTTAFPCPHRGIAFQRVGAVPLDPIDHHVPDPYATKLRSRSHALNGHRIPAQGANPGDPPGKRNTRSEGTPHSLRVSDIDHGLSYAVFLQNTPILSDGIPRAMPWAGMRCPVGANGAMACSSPCPRREVNQLACRALIRLRRFASSLFGTPL